MQLMGSDLMCGRRRDGKVGKGCFACTSGAMRIDNGLHLMSGGKSGSTDKKEGQIDQRAGGQHYFMSI